MAEPTQPVTTETTNETVTTQPAQATRPAAPVATETVATENPRSEHRITVAERVVYLIGGILMALLGLRFILMLMGANSGAGFADFVYSVTHPFVSPFFGLFNYDETFGRSRFEYETLIAMLVYAIVIVVIGKLVALPSRRER
jgi:hypothetical protein